MLKKGLAGFACAALAFTQIAVSATPPSCAEVTGEVLLFSCKGTDFSQLARNPLPGRTVNVAFVRQGAIRGRVYHAQTEVPLPGVNLVLGETRLGTTTDREGMYVLPNVPPGTYTLKASMVGYESELVEGIEVEVGSSIRVDIALRETVFLLGEIAVTATRSEKELFRSHNAVTVVTNKEIKGRTPRTTPEILREEPGLFIQKTTPGHGAPCLRGLMGYQVLILVNGIRLNNSTFRYGPNQYLSTIDPHQIERVEVVRGPGSVLYGSDAQGGVINIITKRPVRLHSTFNLDTQLSSKYSTADEEKMGRLTLSGGYSNLGFSVGVTHRDVGDLRAGAGLGVQSPTGWRETDGDVTLSYTIAQNQDVTFGYQTVQQRDVPRYDRYAGGRYATGKQTSGAYSTYLYTQQNRDLAYVEYNLREATPFLQRLTAQISLHRQKEGREMQKEGETERTVEEDDTKTLGFSVQCYSLLGRRHQLSYGVEAYRDDIGSTRVDIEETTGSEQSGRGRYPDGSSFESYALYGHDEVQVLSNLTLSVGGRLSGFRLKAELKDSTFGAVEATTEAITGGIGVVYGLAENVNLTLGMAQAFRAPNIDDQTTWGDFHAGFEVPSPGLEAERSLTYEIGLKAKYRKWAGSLTSYLTELNDLIDRVPSTYQGSPTFNGEQIWKKTNIAEARIKGVEAEVEWTLLPAWTLAGNVMWTYGQDLSSDEPLRRIPPLMGLLGVKWQPHRRKFWGECFGRLARKQDRLSEDDKADVRIPIGGTPGWTTFTIRAGVNLGRDVSLIMGLENIFDTAYREHGSGVNGPGRNFIAYGEILI